MSNRATARNFQSNASSPAEEQRKRMLKKIHAMFRELRSDLRDSPDELKAARLEFVNQILNWRKPVTSMRDLKPSHLSRIIDAIQVELRQPGIWGYKEWIDARKIAGRAEVKEREPQGCTVEDMGGEIIHLATKEQVWAINKIFAHLRWPEEKKKEFLGQRFSVSAVTFLKPREANDLIPILLRIAIHKKLKREDPTIKKISNRMIWANMRAMKRQLGLDQAAAR